MCTSFKFQSADGVTLFARTMDWHDFQPEAFKLPRAYSWHSNYNQQEIRNPYALIGLGRQHPERDYSDVSDGVNEFGLSVQKLTFSHAAEFSSEMGSGNVALAPFEFPLYAMGHFRSVDEVLANLDKISLMIGQYRNPDLHFAMCDTSGRMFNIEPIGGKLLARENPVGVLTNVPKFDRELERLQDYLTFSDQISLNRLSTGSFSGKKTMPGGFTPSARFARTVLLKEYAVSSQTEKEALVEALHILNSVTVPKSEKRSDTYTVYRSIASLREKKIYYQFYADLAVQTLEF